MGAGFLYGLVSGSALRSTSSPIGGYAKYLVSYKLSFPFLLFADISAQYETFGVSAYDPPSGGDLKSSLNQTVVTADAGIRCGF